MPDKKPLAKREKKQDSYLPDIHRLLPASADAEQGVICSFLLAPREVGDKCIERRITHEMFHIPAHSKIYSCMISMHIEQEPIDLVTLTQKLRDWNELDATGGAAFITQLFTFLPTAANFLYYLEILEEKFTLREIIRICTEYAARSYDEQSEVTMILDELETRVMGIAKTRVIRSITVKDLIMQVLNKFDFAYAHPGKLGGMSTGFPELDRKIDGLHAEEMIVIAARPGHGKTAIAMNIVEALAIDQKRPVAVFSLEMSGEQLVQRLLCSRARVNWFRFRDGGVAERDFPALTSAASHIAEAKIFIEDDAGMSIQEIRARARRLRSEHGIEAIFLDYLQLATSTSRKAQDNRQVEVMEVSQGCKKMARELGIPVVALAQIDRGVEKGQKTIRKARLSDLRDSGSIEQDADTVAFLRLEELYAENEEEARELEGKATLDIAKQRHGPLGEVPLTYLKAYTRFETRAFIDLDDVEQQKLL